MAASLARLQPLGRGSVLALLGAGAMVVLLDLAGDYIARAPVRESYVPSPLVGVARNYGEALSKLNSNVESAEARAADSPDQWLVQESLAGAYLARARLTGSYDDYGAADGALSKALRLAPAGLGPNLTAATLHFSLHRLPEASLQLDRIGSYAVPVDAGDYAEVEAARGDIAFYRGSYGEALTHYDRADQVVPHSAAYRRAIYYSKTGDPERAEALFNLAERNVRHLTPQLRGNFELQRGILDLDRHRWRDALAHFKRADELFPGHWLIEEHIAEVTALLGDVERASRLYSDIVRRTGHPEFMDALASLAERRGNAKAASYWRGRAARVWRHRLARFPEASFGHALDHCVSQSDWRCALDLARRNHAARPYGDAKIALAQALLHNGRSDEAKQIVRQLLSSPWKSRDLRPLLTELGEAR